MDGRRRSLSKESFSAKDDGLNSGTGSGETLEVYPSLEVIVVAIVYELSALSLRTPRSLLAG